MSQSEQRYAFDLTGNVAVVIGGTSGIGEAISIALAEAGADVIPTGRREAECHSVGAQVESRGRRTLAITTDVARRDSVQRLHDAVTAAFGNVDILVNCAGTTKRTPTAVVAEAEWNGIFDINVTGTLRACQIFGPGMAARGYGRIVNIASLSTFVALYEVAAYCASKAAVASLTKSLALEWAKQGVTVNAIAPGVIRTDLNKNLLDNSPRGQEFLIRTPAGRFGQASEIAPAAVFLASPAASFVNGVILPVDGGFLASGVNQ